MKKLNFWIMFVVAVGSALGLTLSTGADAQVSSSATAQQEQSSQQQQQQYGGTQSITSYAEKPDAIPRTFYPMAAPSPPQHAGYWGIITRDGRQQPVKNLLQWRPDWTMADAESLINRVGEKNKKKNKLEIRASSFSGAIPSPAARFVIKKPQSDEEIDAFRRAFVLVGDISVYGEIGPDTQEVLGHCIKEALRMGDTIIPDDEGAALELCSKSFYWAVGISPSMAGGGGSGNLGASVGIGLGGGKANAWYSSKPWINVKVFKQVATYRPYAAPTKTAPKVSPNSEAEVKTTASDIKGGKEPAKRPDPPMVAPR